LCGPLDKLTYRKPCSNFLSSLSQIRGLSSEWQLVENVSGNSTENFYLVPHLGMVRTLPPLPIHLHGMELKYKDNVTFTYSRDIG
jgi:hypothetical protein